MTVHTRPKFVSIINNSDHRGEDGKPITKARNLCTSPPKKGQLAYFEPIKSLATSDKKDIFLEEGKRLLREQNQTFSIGRK
jgi:hypothetical protein